MSVTMIGIFVTFLMYAASHFGLPFTEAELATAVEVIVGFGGLLVAWWGRYRQGDVDLVGMKS